MLEQARVESHLSCLDTQSTAPCSCLHCLPLLLKENPVRQCGRDNDDGDNDNNSIDNENDLNVVLYLVLVVGIDVLCYKPYPRTFLKDEQLPEVEFCCSLCIFTSSKQF